MSSDHTPFIVNIFIFEKQFQTRKQTIIKNSKEEMRFITKIIKSVKRLNTDHIESKEDLEQLIQVVHVQYRQNLAQTLKNGQYY